MNAGKMRERVTLLKPSRVIANTGETTITYERRSLAWAEVVQPKAGEIVRNQLTTTSKDYIIRMRYVAGVDETWRVEWKGNTLEVSSVVADPKKRHIEIIAHLTT